MPYDENTQVNSILLSTIELEHFPKKPTNTCKRNYRKTL